MIENPIPAGGPGSAKPRPAGRRRWRRRLLWSVLVAVVVIAAAFFGGGGWYFAGQIRSGALAVEPGAAMSAYDDVRVVAVSAGQVQLRAIGDQPGLAKPELYGMAWQGGIGHLGTAVTVSGGVVTRPLTVEAGSPPRAWQLAAIDRAYFLDDPRVALGIPMRDVVVDGPLGPLPAWYFPGRGSIFIIGVHGQNGTRTDLLRVVGIAHDLGFPALSVTYRNDRSTVRDPSGYLQYGQTEWRDLQAAVRWALAHGAQHVILAGQSMGGAVVAAFLEHSPLAPKAVRVVLDAPMLDLQAVVGYGASQRSLPVIGSIPAPLTWTAEQIASARFGLSWQATDYLADTSWLKVPTLVTHGTADPTVPITVSSRLKALKPSLVTLARFPGAGHVESWNINRTRYTSLLTSFLSPSRAVLTTKHPETEPANMEQCLKPVDRQGMAECEGGVYLPGDRVVVVSSRSWRCRAGWEGTPMLTVVPDPAGREGAGSSSLIDEIVREGARRILAEANVYIAAHSAERGEDGRRPPPIFSPERASPGDTGANWVIHVGRPGTFVASMESLITTWLSSRITTMRWRPLTRGSPDPWLLEMPCSEEGTRWPHPRG